MQRLRRRKRGVQIQQVTEPQDAEHRAMTHAVQQQQEAMAEHIVAMDALLQDHAVRE